MKEEAERRVSAVGELEAEIMQKTAALIAVKLKAEERARAAGAIVEIERMNAAMMAFQEESEKSAAEIDAFMAELLKEIRYLSDYNRARKMIEIAEVGEKECLRKAKIVDAMRAEIIKLEAGVPELLTSE